MWKVLVVFCGMFLLTACATAYKPIGLGGGYSDMALSKNMYKVSFRGNGFTSQERVQDFLLRRCAQLTIQNGYKYFVIVGGNTFANQSVVTTPTTVQSNSYNNYYGSGSMNMNTYGNSMAGTYNLNGYGNQSVSTTITPGQEYIVKKYESVAMIKMLENGYGYPTAFNAEIILSNFEKNN